MDAVHLSLASTAKADAFATTDDRFFRKAVDLPDLQCEVVTLLSLFSEVSR